MKPRHDVQKLLLGFGLALLLFSGGGALGIVWVRQQTARVAARVQYLESSMEEVERRNRYLDAKIAAVHQPEYLDRRVAARLAPPVEHQIVWITVRKRPQWVEAVSEEPFSVSLDLALLQSLGSPPR